MEQRGSESHLLVFQVQRLDQRRAGNLHKRLGRHVGLGRASSAACQCSTLDRSSTVKDCHGSCSGQVQVRFRSGSKSWYVIGGDQSPNIQRIRVTVREEEGHPSQNIGIPKPADSNPAYHWKQNLLRAGSRLKRNLSEPQQGTLTLDWCHGSSPLCCFIAFVATQRR